MPCTDDAHMIGMCDVAQVVRNNEHSLPVVEGCVKRFRVAGRCIGILAEVEECVSVVLVEVNEYTTLPRTLVSSSSSPASETSDPAFDPVDSKDDSPRRAVGRPSGNKGMLLLHVRPGHCVVGQPFHLGYGRG